MKSESSAGQKLPVINSQGELIGKFDGTSARDETFTLVASPGNNVTPSRLQRRRS